MENKNIHIPKPCNEDWSKMTSIEKGKHCNACQKTVIDFTKMKNEEITDYLIAKKEEGVCGRFLSSQITVKKPKHHEVLIDLYQKVEHNSNTLFFKHFSLLIIVFGMLIVGCDIPKKNKKGEIKNVAKREIVIEKDSVLEKENITLGLPIFPKDDLKCSKNRNEKKIENDTSHTLQPKMNIIGDIQLIEKEEVTIKVDIMGKVQIKKEEIITGLPIMIEDTNNKNNL